MSLLSTSTVPNLALTGAELKQVILDNLKQVLDNDCQFNPFITYRRAAFTVTVVLHAINPDTVVPKPRARAQTFPKADPGKGIEAKLPLDLLPDEEGVLIGLERTVTVDNPNLTRVHHGIPIVVAQKAMPAPDEIFPKIDKQELRYEPGDFPPLAAPVDTDVSEREAQKLGVTARDAKAEETLRRVKEQVAKSITAPDALPQPEDVVQGAVRNRRKPKEEPDAAVE